MSGMVILRGFLLSIEVVSAFLLIIVILMQKTKSQGMGLAFGGAMGESLFGAQMGNVLTKVTVVLAVVFLVNTTLLAMIGPVQGKQSIADSIPASQAAPMSQPAQGQVPMAAPIEGTTPAAAPMDAAMPVVPVEAPAPVVPAPTE